MTSKKDYTAIAKAINDNTRVDYPDSVRKTSLVTQLCAYFKSDNDNFNIGRFMKACGSIRE